jgi:uncharacterized membrane protein
MQYLKSFFLLSLVILPCLSQIVGNSTEHHKPFCCNGGQIVTIIVISLIGVSIMIGYAMYCFPCFKSRFIRTTLPYDIIA